MTLTRIFTSTILAGYSGRDETLFAILSQVSTLWKLSSGYKSPFPSYLQMTASVEPVQIKVLTIKCIEIAHDDL